MTDEDHRIHAIAQLGDVVRYIDERRGVLIEAYRTTSGEDCTDAISRLRRAGLVEVDKFKYDITSDAMPVIHAKLAAGTIVMRKRKP